MVYYMYVYCVQKRNKEITFLWYFVLNGGKRVKNVSPQCGGNIQGSIQRTKMRFLIPRTSISLANLIFVKGYSVQTINIIMSFFLVYGLFPTLGPAACSSTFSLFRSMEVNRKKISKYSRFGTFPDFFNLRLKFASSESH